MSFEIYLKNSDRTLRYDSKATLLEFLEENNVAVDSMCRSASCGTCLVKCLEGKVRTIADSTFLTEEEKAEGLTLTCVSLPFSNLILEL